jgi:hypothetical protein
MATQQGGDLFIVDNSDTDWKVSAYLAEWCELSLAIDIATGYFEIGALLSLREKWQSVDRIRILMGNVTSSPAPPSRSGSRRWTSISAATSWSRTFGIRSAPSFSRRWTNTSATPIAT